MAHNGEGQAIMHTLKTLLGFNGELFESTTGHYLLGNGYRAYSPVLMIFIQPDSWSPFGAGGLNAYAYCGGDPVNYCDPTGHAGWLAAWKRQANSAERLKAPVGVGEMPMAIKRAHDQAFPDNPLDLSKAAGTSLDPLDLSKSTGTWSSSGASASTSVVRPRSPSLRPSADHAVSTVNQPSLLHATREVRPRQKRHRYQLTPEIKKALETAIATLDASAFNQYASMNGIGRYSLKLLNVRLPETSRQIDWETRFTLGDRTKLLAETSDEKLVTFLNGIEDTIRRVG